MDFVQMKLSQMYIVTDCSGAFNPPFNQKVPNIKRSTNSQSNEINNKSVPNEINRNLESNKIFSIRKKRISKRSETYPIN